MGITSTICLEHRLYKVFDSCEVAFPSLTSTRLYALNVVVTLVKISSCSNDTWNC